MKDLVEFPLKVMNIWGYLVPKPNAKTVIILLISELSLAATVAISTANYFYTNGMYEVINNFQSNLGMFNTFAKLTCCVFYKTEFLNLIEKRKGFWNTNTCSTATKKTVSWILDTVGFLQRAFVNQTVVAVLGFMIPFSIVKKTLAFGSFDISDDPLIYSIVWTNNALSILIGAFAIIGFDSLFMGLCYEVITQFKILYDHLERLDVENINSEEELEDFLGQFKVYLKHHRFLIGYIQDMKKCFSIVYLIQYLTTAPSFCTFMFVALESPVFMTKFISVVVGFDTICEFAIFCIPTTYMIEETPKIANAIYNSNWHGKHFGKLKKLTQLKIQDAQKEIRMTSLGGMVDINAKTLITIVRTSFSICTVLLNLKK